MKVLRQLAVLAFLAGVQLGAHATTMTYTPVNPDFGGAAANASGLLAEAQAQNGTHAPTKASTSTSSSSSSSSSNGQLNSFINSLQSAILSNLSSAIVSEIVGPTGKITPGVLNTTNFTITVTDLGGGNVQITTLSKATGQTATFEISQGD